MNEKEGFDCDEQHVGEVREAIDWVAICLRVLKKNDFELQYVILDISL